MKFNKQRKKGQPSQPTTSRTPIKSKITSKLKHWIILVLKFRKWIKIWGKKWWSHIQKFQITLFFLFNNTHIHLFRHHQRDYPIFKDGRGLSCRRQVDEQSGVFCFPALDLEDDTCIPVFQNKNTRNGLNTYTK